MASFDISLIGAATAFSAFCSQVIIG